MKIIDKTGLLCRETYPINFIDENGKKKPIIDFNNKKVTIYNNKYGLERVGLLTTVVGYLDSGVLEDTLAYKDDSLMHISDKPIIDTNIAIKRGGSSALENHYKMSECNTLEDLENYGNNIFNL